MTTQPNYDNAAIPIVTKVKLLGVIGDSKLRFDKVMCKDVASKVHLLNISAYMFTFELKATLIKLFIQTRFDYCSSL